MATRTLKLPRAFTRDDGRERIAVPLWNGILSALGSVATAFFVMFIAMVVLFVAAILITGRTPSTNPGHPVLAVAELIFYGAGGAFAWWRLRAMNVRPFRKLRTSDVRAILTGIGVLMLVRIGTGLLLVLTDQTKHVQSGFEHFDVKSTVPAITTLSSVLAISTMAIVAPIVEEAVFRGLLFGALASRLGIAASALITALLFGAVHGDPVLFPTIAALGLITALAYAATANLWVPIILHALNNALGAIFLVMMSLKSP